MPNCYVSILCGLALCMFSGLVQAARIAIVIDDLGERLEQGERIINLPGPVACSFLPFAPATEKLAVKAHANGKEVLLHQPMQSVGQSTPGKTGFVLDMNRAQMAQVLSDNLKSVPFVSGVNNHMGSLITQHPGHMRWFMHEMSRHKGLFFIDSRTTVYTVAEETAREFGVPVIRRHVFLDHHDAAEGIDYEFKRLIRLAKRNGYALAIGHPNEQTIEYLENALPFLEMYSVELVPVKQIIQQSNINPLPVERWELKADYPTDY